MDQLAHHEFGLGHRPFDFDGRTRRGDPSDSNHWLRQWVAAHRFLLDQPEVVRGRQMFVDVDALARDASAADAAIARIETAIAARAAAGDALARRHAALKARMAEAVSALDDVIARGTPA